MGGWSPEREVSLKSGKNVVNGLKKLGYDVYPIDVKKDLRYITAELYKANPDYIFNTLHGVGGEDGVIQGILEVFGKPYSNSGVLGSAVCFSKLISKYILGANGIRVIKGLNIKKNDLKNIDPANPIEKYPFVIKPSESGSSVGIFLIFDENDLKKVQNTVWDFGEDILIEKYIKGREFTVLVANGKVLGSVEITYKNEFYDYASKYNTGGSSHVADYYMPNPDQEEMYKMAEKSYNLCKCSGIARIDFLYDGEKPYFLEVNTQPGMTEMSLVPDIAKYNGISFEEILEMCLKYS